MLVRRQRAKAGRSTFQVPPQFCLAHQHALPRLEQNRQPARCSSFSFCPPADRIPVPQIAVKEKLVKLIAEGGGGHVVRRSFACHKQTPSLVIQRTWFFGLHGKCSVDAVDPTFLTATSDTVHAITTCPTMMVLFVPNGRADAMPLHYTLIND